MKKFFILTLSLLMTAPLLFAQATQVADPSAALEVRSTTQGFLPPRMTETERDQISSPAVGLILYNTTQKSLEMHLGSNEWRKVTKDIEVVSSLPTSGVTDGDAYIETHSNTLNIFSSGFWYSFNHDKKTTLIHNGLTYKTITSPGTGEIWLDRNIGATLKPNAITDTGSDFGNFFTWADATAADVCPSDFRLPTRVELEAEVATFATNGGNNHTGAWNVLNLTRTGYRDTANGSGASGTDSVGTDGYYWSSTANGSDAWIMAFSSSSAGTSDPSKSFGLAVRCIQD